MTAPERPLTLLIAALGGEGGGVLTHWIVAAAASLGFPVQSTSIPGVAQRTGATTYYVEILPLRWDKLDGRAPVLALAPGVGDVDIVLASELMEATRAVANGYVAKDRTFVVASTHRQYAIAEKVAMADGRYASARLTDAIAQHAEGWLTFDMEAVAREAGAMINAVMLGALAASGRLPLPTDALIAAIRAEGKSAEANIKGFEAGLKAGERATATANEPVSAAAEPPRVLPCGGAGRLHALEAQAKAALPDAAAAVAVEGARRLYHYQGRAYARLYLDRLQGIAEADKAARTGGRLVRETARLLALRMSYEDVIRVAAEKIAPGRFAAIARDMSAGPGEPVRIFEFMRPGLDEFAQVLPPALARRLVEAAERRPWLQDFHLTLELESTSITGFLRLWALARLRPLRPWTNRYREEQRAIEDWLALIAEAAEKSAALALEVAACAELLKGYGDTLARGRANFRLIEAQAILPALSGELPLAVGVDAVASARAAALADPEGAALAACLADIGRRLSPARAAE